MRVRTEDKRQEIVAIAGQLFEDLGYDRASMSLISQRVGGSKATLYGYFRSKEELLLATIDYDVSENAERLTHELLSAPTLREGLIRLGVGYMMRRLAPRPISNVRIVSTQPEETGIGRIFYDNILQPAWRRLSDRFEIMMEEGLLKRADPWVMAMQWKGLVEWDMVDRRVLGAIREADPDEIKRAATLAADAFLQLYGAGCEGEGPNIPPSSAPGAKPRVSRRKRGSS